MQDLQGKVAVVTGASRGIGGAIAALLAQRGAQVVMVARSAQRLESARAALAAKGGRVSALVQDLQQPEAAAAVHAAVLAEHGRIDLLINCAGAARVGDFLQFTEEDWSAGFALKFSGARRLCAQFWGDLVRSGGSIVNVVGAAGRTPTMEYTLGGAVNAALLAFTKALAQRGIRDGVQVNAVNPGPVRTDRTAANLQRLATEQGITVEKAAERLVAQSGMTRLGEPEEVAALVAFIVSPAGRWLQGALIDIDGGQTKSL